MTSAPSILNIHTPSESFALVHSHTQESLDTLYDKLTRKAHTSYHGQRVGPGWLKYDFNDSTWNLDDESDYTIFVWRQLQLPSPDPDASTSPTEPLNTPSPTLYLHNPAQALPIPPAYQNPAYYVFHTPKNHLQVPRALSPRPHSSRSRKTKGSRAGTQYSGVSAEDGDGNLKHKKEFERFHSENGVRTVSGNIGPVKGVRMLLKSGYRHVYIKRDFAVANGFISPQAAPGYGGYTGLVNIGTWPITLTRATPSGHPDARIPHSSESQRNGIVNGVIKKKKSHPTWDVELHGSNPTMMTVYLSEEPHFDVVLGRSFFEKRQIQVDPVNLTDVVCLDTGEKIECDVIILKDGKGQIVTVT